jgi:hypothetical protein
MRCVYIYTYIYIRVMAHSIDIYHHLDVFVFFRRNTFESHGFESKFKLEIQQPNSRYKSGKRGNMK